MTDPLEPSSTKTLPLPRISLVTPVFNSAKYIEQTFLSVLSQNYPNLEYFVVDGGSTDGTLDIIRKYESRLTGWISEPDDGMYDALNKGFARATGEIMGWISATDLLHPGGLRIVGTVFYDLPDVEWITGRATASSEDGMTTWIEKPLHWSRYRFLMGANHSIQQESTFWRRNLWDKAGGYVDASRRLASDFELWVRFFRHARLYPVEGLIGSFRVHGDSLGLQLLGDFYRIHDEVIEKELERVPWGKGIRLFRRAAQAVAPIPKVRGLWQRVVTHSLYHMHGRDFAPVIRYDVQSRRWHI